VSKIDEFSHTLGALEAGIKGLARSLDADREASHERHRENSDALKAVHARLDTLHDGVVKLSLDVEQDRAIAAQERAAATLDRAGLHKTVDDHEKRLKLSEAFQGRVGQVLVVAGAIVSAALYLVWHGIQAFGGEIKAWLLRLFN
jgi:hypothetical protein